MIRCEDQGEFLGRELLLSQAVQEGDAWVGWGRGGMDKSLPCYEIWKGDELDLEGPKGCVTVRVTGFHPLGALRLESARELQNGRYSVLRRRAVVDEAKALLEQHAALAAWVADLPADEAWDRVRKKWQEVETGTDGGARLTLLPEDGLREVEPPFWS